MNTRYLMSRSVTPLPPVTRLKTSSLGPKKPQKDPTDNETSNNEAQARELAINFLTAKEYLTPGNPITLHVLAHVLSQLGSAASKMPKALTDGIKAIVTSVFRFGPVRSFDLQMDGLGPGPVYQIWKTAQDRTEPM